MPVTVTPLSPADAPAWLDFFDRRAFADNPEWSTCYCRAFLVEPGEDWDASCAAGLNRAPMAAAIAAGAVHGALARREGRIVGWAHFGRADRFTTPARPLFPAYAGRGDVAAIVCFVVEPAARGTGVARALLRGSLDALGARGFREVVARAAPEGDDSPHQFTGPLGLYLAEGFTHDPAGTERRPWVRCTLRDDHEPAGGPR